MAALVPLCLSMIICDQVVFDPTTRKPSILGVVHELHGHSFPAASPRLDIGAELTNGRGLLPIDFVALASGGLPGGFEPIAVARVPVSFAHPLEVQIAGAQPPRRG